MIEQRIAESEEMTQAIAQAQKQSQKVKFDENMAKTNWKMTRLFSNYSGYNIPIDKDVNFSKVVINNKKCLLAEEKDNLNNNLIIYIHGGGFVLGDFNNCKGYISEICKQSGCKVLALNYSLAPEKPYPHALNDIYSSYCEIISMTKYQTSKIAVIGECAGGNLALVFTLMAKEKGIKMPSCVVLNSPITDLTENLDRTIHDIDDSLVKDGIITGLNDVYVKSEDNTNYRLSPVYGDFSNFPDTLITVDSNETLYADSLELHNKLEEAGRNVKMIEYITAIHSFATLGSLTPESKEVLIETCDFINKSLK